MFLLSLLVALTSTPLRIAEAADDLARALAEAGTGENLQEVDGGVGDDSGAMVKANPLVAGDASDAGYAPYPYVRLVPVVPERVIPRSADLPGWIPSGASRRHALLQCYLC